MKKKSQKNLFVSVVAVCMLFLFLESCQKGVEMNDPKAISEFSQSTITKSTIIYTDITPDVTETGSITLHQSYYLDLNNDNTADFQIEAYYGGYKYIRSDGVRISSINGTEVACDGLNLPLAMNPGDKVNSNLNWVSTNPYDASINHNGALKGQSTSMSGPWGNWITTTDHYLGLKIKSGNNTYYGWARLSVSVVQAKSSVTIKDYANNGVPNSPILAGQTK